MVNSFICYSSRTLTNKKYDRYDSELSRKVRKKNKSSTFQNKLEYYFYFLLLLLSNINDEIYMSEKPLVNMDTLLLSAIKGILGI